MNSSESGIRFYYSLALIVALAAWWRLAGIAIEPFWLDEVFTSFLGSGTFREVIYSNARDTHPPLYFLGVAAVRQILGDSEVVIRGLSTIWSLLGIVVIMFFGRDLGGLRVAVMAGLLAMVNPLDVYYAQEARMYSQAATLAIASSWFLQCWIRARGSSKTRAFHWGWWAFFYWGASVLLCYTHLIGTAVLFVQGIFALTVLTWQRRFRQAFVLTAIGLSCVAAVIAWAYFVIEVRGVFFSNTILGWIPPQTLASGFLFLVDQYFLAFCGCIPGEIRTFVSLLAWLLVLFVLGSGVFHFARYRTPLFRKHWAIYLDLDRAFLLWLTIGPVLFVLLASRLFNPIYYPPRFSLLVLAPFLVLAAVETNQLQSKRLGRIVFGALLVLMGVGSWCQAVTITKAGMADFAELWHREGPPDAALFSPGHNRLVASYYTGQVIQPVHRTSLEQRLRTGPLTLWVCSALGTSAPNTEAQRLADWVEGLGPYRKLGIFDGLLITEVTAKRTPKVYPPLPETNRINFGAEAAERFLWQGWYHGEKSHRWSRGGKAELVFALEDPEHFSRITLKMFCSHHQNISIVLNQQSIDSFYCENRSPHIHESVVPTKVFATKNTLTFLLPDAIAPDQVSASKDSRKLAVGIQWLQIDEAR